MKIYIFVLFLFAFEFGIASEGKGYKIAKSAEQAQSGVQGVVSSMELKLISSKGKVLTRRMKNWAMEQNKVDQSLIKVELPKDVSGTKLLTSSYKALPHNSSSPETAAYKSKPDDQWLYLPSSKKVHRIRSSQKGGAFMGSEFSFEDLTPSDVDKFTFKYIKEGQIQGRKVDVVDRFPKNKSTYFKQRVHLDKEYQLPLKVEYYNRKKQLFKVSLASDFKKIKKWWFTGKLAMENLDTGKKSEILWSNRKVLQPLKAHMFNPKKLAL